MRDLFYAGAMVTVVGLFGFALAKTFQWARRKELQQYEDTKKFVESQFEEAHQCILRERAKRFSIEPSEN